MSEWEPATDAEVAMRDALRTDDQESYFRILAGVDLLLPVSADVLAGTAPMGWGTWSTGGRTHVLAFTSNAALQACLADYSGSARRVPYSELANTWPNLEWWLAVNPGLPIEGYLPAWFVAQLARGDLRLPTRGPGRESHAGSKIQELGAAALAASRSGGENGVGGPTYDQATAGGPRATSAPGSAPVPASPSVSPAPAAVPPPLPQPASPVAPAVAPIPPVGNTPPMGPGGLPIRTPSGTSPSGLPVRTPVSPAVPGAYQPPAPAAYAPPAVPSADVPRSPAAPPAPAAHPLPPSRGNIGSGMATPGWEKPVVPFRPEEDPRGPLQDLKAPLPVRTPMANTPPVPEHVAPYNPAEALVDPNWAGKQSPKPAGAPPAPPIPPAGPVSGGALPPASGGAMPSGSGGALPRRQPGQSTGGGSMSSMAGFVPAATNAANTGGNATPPPPIRPASPAATATGGPSAAPVSGLAGTSSAPGSGFGGPPAAPGSGFGGSSAAPVSGFAGSPASSATGFDGAPSTLSAGSAGPASGSGFNGGASAPSAGSSAPASGTGFGGGSSAPSAGPGGPASNGGFGGPSAAGPGFGGPAAVSGYPGPGGQQPVSPAAPPVSSAPPYGTGSSAASPYGAGSPAAPPLGSGSPAAVGGSGGPGGALPRRQVTPPSERPASMAAAAQALGARPPASEQAPPAWDRPAPPQAVDRFGPSGPAPSITPRPEADSPAATTMTNLLPPVIPGASGAGRGSSSYPAGPGYGSAVPTSSAAPAVPAPPAAGTSYGLPPQGSPASAYATQALGGSAFATQALPVATGGYTPAGATNLGVSGSATGSRGPASEVFVPANDVERELQDAADTGNNDVFLSTLLLAQVMVPVASHSRPGSAPGESGFAFQPEEFEGERYLIVFTSKDRLSEHFGEPTRTVGVRFYELIRNWPDPTWSFAVNPGTPVGAKYPGAQIIALANWATEAGLGSEPVEAPPAETEAAPVPAPEPASDEAQQATVMQKTIAAEQVDYYLDRGYDRVAGFVHRASEVEHLRTPGELFGALGLYYDSSPFQPDAKEAFVLRWPAYRPSLYRIPYGGQNEQALRAMDGWVIERPPFRGNGFAPGEGRDVIAEFKVDSVRLPHGAQLWSIDADGNERMMAIFDADGPQWRRVGEQ
ncbi:SseB family protein [Actinoplanes italicus]|uniref:Type III secretion system (T3SS) SseB-like protein n=1 Tax=Actinoplanes italicus TaxID=113567 RepID=A0A2T0JXK4_9ACTN|nr:SseB family protein [Actinoplanes italicus]PRX12912.1 type III secretion system (T3SS) SseB-like protein [Actinoplanes italicus]